ncbi:unnamed protein product [Oikopleura dioica]|uniref:Uncharacterized protein n=1 Tax=Oikopleura dioica TaxID=34765 RepID=E4YVT2_OIKDI|nr:unnamed protein product [Oikopleura dioica]
MKGKDADPSKIPFLRFQKYSTKVQRRRLLQRRLSESLRSNWEKRAIMQSNEHTVQCQLWKKSTEK